MIDNSTPETSFLDVWYHLKEVQKAPSPQIAAVKFIARVLGVPMNKLRADIAIVEDMCSKIEPRSRGIDPKTFSNKKATCKTALLASGLVKCDTVRVNQFTYLSPEWAELELAAETKRARISLCGFIRYCDRRAILRASVNDSILAAYEEHLRATSRRSDQHKVVRTTAVVWNETRQKHPEFAMGPLTVPLRRTKQRLVPFDAFTVSLQTEWDRVTKWAAVIDVTSDDVRSTAIGLRTLRLWGQYLRCLVTALVKTGTPCDELTSLSDVLSIENFDRAMTYQVYDVAGGKATHGNYYMAKVFLGIARDCLKLDAGHLAQMKRIVDAIPVPTFEMTEKNKHLTLRFDDPKVRNRFLTAPDRIWADMLKGTRPNLRRLATAQASVGIQTLSYIPFRLENLTSLEFDRHIFLRAGGTSTFYIPAAEAKGGKNLEFDIPTPLVERLLEYRDVIAPSVIGQRPKYLFHNLDNTNKHFSSVRYLIQEYFKKYVGFQMNPHAYRHLAAKSILDANGGAHAVLKDLLGHKSLSTTVNFYTGTDTKRAGRFHADLVERHTLAARHQTNAQSNC